MADKNSNMTRPGLPGIILRFPIFLIIAGGRIFIATPFEFIVKLVAICLFVFGSIMKYRWAVTYKDDRKYCECMDEWREAFSGFFRLKSLDLKGTVKFLKYGKFSRM